MPKGFWLAFCIAAAVAIAVQLAIVCLALSYMKPPVEVTKLDTVNGNPVVCLASMPGHAFDLISSTIVPNQGCI